MQRTFEKQWPEIHNIARSHLVIFGERMIRKLICQDVSKTTLSDFKEKFFKREAVLEFVLLDLARNQRLFFMQMQACAGRRNLIGAKKILCSPITMLINLLGSALQLRFIT